MRATVRDRITIRDRVTVTVTVREGCINVWMEPSLNRESKCFRTLTLNPEP